MEIYSNGKHRHNNSIYKILNYDLRRRTDFITYICIWPQTVFCNSGVLKIKFGDIFNLGVFNTQRTNLTQFCVILWNIS